jgi:phosphoenolpyruvate-protein kinase (PTS system EI component)
LALEAQLRAIVAAAAGTELRVLLPMVEHAAQVDAVRERLQAIEGGAGAQLGAMVESVTAVANIDEIAAAAEFISIGTNDLTHSALATDRFSPGEAFSHHPVVLSHIARTIEGASAHGRLVEVCGEASGDSTAMPLLLGLGVAELSSGAARVGTVRSWVRALDYGEMRELAGRALACDSAHEVLDLVRPTADLLGQLDDVAGQGVESGAGVLTLGGQP